MPLVDPFEDKKSKQLIDPFEDEISPVLAKPEAGPTPSPKSGSKKALGKIGHAMSTFGSGFNQALADIAGLPVDAINALLGSTGIPVSQEPIMGSEFIKKRIMPEPVKPEGLLENILHAGGEQTAGVLPGVGLFGRAGKAGQFLGMGVKEAAKLVGGAGTGSGIARTYAPDSPMADLSAQVAGGAAVNTRQLLRGLISTTSPDLERRMLQRVNKFSTTLSPEERMRRLDTQLNEGIRTSKAGLEENQAAISNINKEIQQKISTLSEEGAVVSREKVLAPVEAWRDVEMAKQPLPAKATEQINSIIEEFKTAQPDKLTLRQSQNFKQTINKELDDFYKAVQYSPDKTAQLAQAWVNKTKGKLADGLRKEISEIWPEVKGLNKEEAARIQLNKSLERTLNRIGNRDIISLKFLAAFLRGPKTAVVEYLLNNPKIQSSLAVAIRQSRLKAAKQMGIFMPGEPPNMGPLPEGPDSFEALKAKVEREAAPTPNVPSLPQIENLREGRPIEMGNPFGTAYFDVEGKTYEVSLPMGYSPLDNEKYGKSWALMKFRGGEAKPLKPVDMSGLFDPKKPPKVDKGQILSAVKLDDGRIYYDENAQIHADVINNLNLPAAKVVEGGFITAEGKYTQGGVDAARIGRQAKAAEEVAQKRAEKTAPKTSPPKGESLLGWIRGKGGIWDKSLMGETKQFGGKEANTVALLRKQTGRSFDELAALAVEDGWLPEGSTSTDFINLFNEEIRGKKAKPLGSKSYYEDDIEALNRYWKELGE